MLDQPVEYKKMYHPFAEKLSPLEEWKQVIIVAIETLVLFITTKIIKNLFYYCWQCIMYILLTPTALIGLLIEFLRKLTTKVTLNSRINIFFSARNQSLKLDTRSKDPNLSKHSLKETSQSLKGVTS